MPMPSANGHATASPARPSAASTRKLARIAGVLFLITFVTAIAGDILYNPVLDDSVFAPLPATP